MIVIPRNDLPGHNNIEDHLGAGVNQLFCECGQELSPACDMSRVSISDAFIEHQREVIKSMELRFQIGDFVVTEVGSYIEFHIGGVELNAKDINEERSEPVQYIFTDRWSGHRSTWVIPEWQIDFPTVEVLT